MSEPGDGAPAETARSRQKQETRSRIVRAALDLMLAHGVANVKASDVAERAGVSHGAVFAHFGTMELLADAACGLRGQDRAAEISATFADPPDVPPRELAILVMEAFWRTSIEDRELIAMHERARWIWSLDRENQERDNVDALREGFIALLLGGYADRPAFAPLVETFAMRVEMMERMYLENIRKVLIGVSVDEAWRHTRSAFEILFPDPGP